MAKFDKEAMAKKKSMFANLKSTGHPKFALEDKEEASTIYYQRHFD